jgi:hypothetical protein
VTGARGFASLFIDRLLDDVVMPHAFERVVHRRKARTKAILDGKFGHQVQSVSDIMHQEMLKNARPKVVAEPEPEPEPELEPAAADDDDFELHTPEELEDHGAPSMTDAELEAAAEHALKDEADAEAERMFELRRLAAEQGVSVEDLQAAMEMVDGEEGADLSAVGWEDLNAAAETAAAGEPSAVDAGEVAEADRLTALHAQQDPDVVAQAKKLEEMMRMAEASGLVSGVVLQSYPPPLLP